MVKLAELVSYLDNLTGASEFEDYAPNGLQVEGSETVKRIVSATSATRNIVEYAAQTAADAILVHHGWFWKSDRLPLTGAFKERVKILFDHDISLIGYHLPLDALPRYGNNEPVLCDFNCSEIELYEGIGYSGLLPEQIQFESFSQQLDDYYHIKGTHLQGTRPVRKVAIVSGGGQSFFRKAIERGDIDAFITGEGTEWVYSLVLDSGVSFSAMGHYQSEEIGPRLLGEHLAEKYKLDVEFKRDFNPF